MKYNNNIFVRASYHQRQTIGVHWSRADIKIPLASNFDIIILDWFFFLWNVCLTFKHLRVPIFSVDNINAKDALIFYKVPINISFKFKKTFPTNIYKVYAIMEWKSYRTIHRHFEEVSFIGKMCSIFFFKGNKNKHKLLLPINRYQKSETAIINQCSMEFLLVAPNFSNWNIN